MIASEMDAFVPRVLVIRRETGRVRRLRDLAVDNLLQRVDALAIRAERVHEMHSVRTCQSTIPQRARPRFAFFLRSRGDQRCSAELRVRCFWKTRT